MLNKVLLSSLNCVSRRCSSLATEKRVTQAFQRQRKKPFIKNLLAGSYDQEFLIYPEIPNEKLKALENKYLSFPKGSSNPRDSLKKIIEFLNSSGKDSETEEGCDFSLCQVARLSEAVPSLPLSISIEIQRICVEGIISNYCTEEQKKKYLSSLLRGEALVALGLSEDDAGSDPSSIKTLAVRNRETDKWTINGVKSWVTNAEFADFFLIFSKTKLHEKSPGTKDLSVFIVDKGCPGLRVEKIPTVGLEECGISRVILDNVTLNDSSVLGKLNIGYEAAVELLNSYKYGLASCFSSELKALLNETVKFISQRKQTLIDLKDSETIRRKLSDVSLTIYALDSMLYLTAGIMDKYEIDATLESATIHLFCLENGVRAVEECIEMLGSRVYNKSSPHFEMFNDLRALCTSLYTKDICKLYVALTGIQHATQIKNDDIYKIRNSFNFPYFFVKKMLSGSRNARDSPKLNLKLYMNLHPSLRASCDQLEYSVYRLQYCTEKLLVRHGSEISQRQLDLARIADVIVDIYAMTAVLGRASRSYCTGIKFADDEILSAKAFCQDASFRCKNAVNGIVLADVISSDLFHLKVADHLFQRGSYFIEHPLTRNIS